MHVCLMGLTLFYLQAICASTVGCFQASITQEKTCQGFLLLVCEVEPLLVFLYCTRAYHSTIAMQYIFQPVADCSALSRLRVQTISSSQRDVQRVVVEGSILTDDFPADYP